MQLKQIVRNIIILTIVMCNIGCDQISKIIVREKIEYNDKIDLINNHFTLTKIENAGAFLSLGDSLPAPVRFILLSLIPLMVLTSAVYIILTKADIKTPIVVGTCFIIGGGLGNLYDRIVYGSVTDFLYMNFVIFQTGIFNMADVSIMIGVLMILIYSFMKKTEIEALRTS